ncbi:MAG: ATP-binding protein [Synergistaceae bacterium]|nr:ATP-binding protein [Synergistaceae bacterium]
MKLIKRERYLRQLRDSEGVPDIKVVTGVRRCGKSRLLEIFTDELRGKYPDANFICIDFSNLEYDNLKEYHALNGYIEKRYTAGVKNFVFIDEVQLCPKFELTVNSLHVSGKYDIYITGSNAFLLGSDLATLFTGRSFSIELFPFSYGEYLQYHELENSNNAFDSYLEDGGMAGSYLYKTRKAKLDYVADVFDTLVLRDVRQKYRIRNAPLLDKLSDFLMDNISNQTSVRSLEHRLKMLSENVTNVTLGKYLAYLCNAFAFYKVRRYDIRGKRYLVTNDKYYLSDHSFRYARLGKKDPDYGRILENIVAIELLRRGYKIYSGELYNKEIDFVAIKRDEKIYIQVAQSIEQEDTLKRETAPLLQIKDAYPKMLITRLQYPSFLYEGIKIADIRTWLSDDEI